MFLLTYGVYVGALTQRPHVSFFDYNKFGQKKHWILQCFRIVFSWRKTGRWIIAPAENQLKIGEDIIEAKKIIDNARQNAKEVKISARNYALSVFEKTEKKFV